MNELVAGRETRRGFLGALAAATAGAVALLGLRRADGADAAPSPEKVLEKVYPVLCEECSRPIDGCTVGLPATLTAEQVMGKISKGHSHDACARAKDERRRKQWQADYDAVVAKKITADQARTVKESSQWAGLSDGKRAAVQDVIDVAASVL